VDDTWVQLDDCGVIVDSESCDHGCADSAGCCGEGSHAEDGACVTDPVEPVPDAGEDEETPMPDEAEPEKDIIEVRQVDSIEESTETEIALDVSTDSLGPEPDATTTVGPSGAGCNSVSVRGPPESLLALLALVLLTLIGYRRRRDENC
jgi:MYXO-CTERM domain-containing protein